MKLKCSDLGVYEKIDTGYLVSNFDNQWRFVSAKSVKEFEGEYAIPVKDLQNGTQVIDWLAHLGQKPWFDHVAFFEAMIDFRNKKQA